METQHTALPEAAPLPLPPSQEPQGLGVKKSGDGGRYKERLDVSLSLQSSVMMAIIQVKCYSLPCVNFLIVTKSLRPHGLYSTMLRHPWDFLGKNIGVGSYFLLQGIFPAQGLNSGLLHCKQLLYCLNHYGTQKARDAFVVFDQTLEESLTSEDSDHKLPQIGWLKKAGILSL